MSQAVQQWIPFFIIPTASILLFCFGMIMIHQYNAWKEKGKKFFHPLKNLLFWSAFLHFIARVAAIIAQIISLAQIPGTRGTIAFLIPWVFSVVPDWIATVFIALHFLDVIFIKGKNVQVGNRPYGVVVVVVSTISILLSVFYGSWIIGVTIRYTSKNPAINRAGWHIMVASYAVIALVALSLVGMVRNLWKHQRPNLYLIFSAKILLIWIGVTVFASLFNISNIYWFELAEDKLSTLVTTETRDILIIGSNVYRSLHIREKQNYLNYLQILFDAIILGWGSMEIIPGSDAYYFFNPTKRTARYLEYYSDRVTFGNTNSGVEMAAVPAVVEVRRTDYTRKRHRSHSVGN